MKKLFPLLLAAALLLCLPGAAAFAAEDGAAVSAPLDFTNVGTGEGQTAPTGEGYKWDASANTLTLKGLNIRVPDESSEDCFAIRVPDGATIELEDGSTSAITSAPISRGCYACSCGIYAEGDLTIRGSGYLLTSGNAAGMTSAGIYAMGSLTVSASTLMACGGEAFNLYSCSYGIYTVGGLTMEKSCSVTAAADNATAEGGRSYGAYVVGSVSMGANCNAEFRGSDAMAGGSGGLHVGGELVLEKGAVCRTEAGEATGSYVGSYGSYVGSGITVGKDSTLIGTAGSASGEDCNSVGVYCESFITNNGTLTAAGNSAPSGSSYGVYVLCGALTNSGSITASEGTGDATAGVYSRTDGVHFTGGTAELSSLATTGSAVISGSAEVSSGYRFAADGALYVKNNAVLSSMRISADGGIYAGSTGVSGAAQSFVSGSTTLLTAAGADPVVIRANIPGFDLQNGQMAADANDHSWKSYSFAGWYENPEGSGDPVTENFAAEKTYYAQWTYGGKRVIPYALDFTAMETTDASALYGYSWDADKKLLTLSGLTADVCQNDPGDAWGILLPAGTTITLADDSVSTVTLCTNSGGDCKNVAVWAKGDLTVSGSGTLYASGSPATGSGSNSYGLYTEGALTNSAVLFATGANAAKASYGLYATGLITNTGSITSAAETASNAAHGIYACSGITGSGDLSGTGGSASYANGINARGDISLTAGTVTATGGCGTSEYYGIWTNSAVTLSGSAKMVLSGNGAAAENAALYLETEAALTLRDSACLTALGNVRLNGSMTLDGSALVSVTGTLRCPAYGDYYTVTGAAVDIVPLSGAGALTPTGGDPVTVSRRLYTVTYYDLSGESFEHLSTAQTTAYLTRPADAKKSGYKLDGWYTDTEFTAAYVFGTGGTPLRADLSLYARWTASDEPDDPDEPDAPIDPTPTPGGDYADVYDTDWFAPYVYTLTEKGILSGETVLGKAYFNPYRSVSRAEICTMLAMASGADVSSYTAKDTPFTDLGDWYDPYVAWAYAQKIVSGTGASSFEPNQPVTRQDLAVMLSGYADYAKLTLSETARDLSLFADAGSIADYAREAVLRMVKAQVISGDSSDGTLRFYPASGATRAETAVMLCLLLWPEA